MCGIAGFSWENPELIQKMTDQIAHRGPDAQGHFIQEISLGHRRLSILDLSEKGKQPMLFDDLVITFNGEIYNYEEIKKELTEKDHTFVSDSDTEVILHAYQEWGTNFVNKMNGMWAFCIFDPKKQLLFLSRDRFGKKPLYFYAKNQKFIFASELCAIRIHELDFSINTNSLNFYFYQKYIGNNQSIFNEIEQLAPSHNLIYDLKKHTYIVEKYYDLEQEIQKATQIPLSERIEKIEQLIEDAVMKRLIADVPVGSFLSGGVDSSTISGIIAKKRKDFDTFSIGFEEHSFNETPHSRLVANHLKTNHHVDILALNQDLIEKIVAHFDEPFGDPSVLPTALLSQMTKRSVTVALSGDAADEIFGGYDVYKAYTLSKNVPKMGINLGKKITNLLPTSDKNINLAFKAKKFFADYDHNPQRRHLNWLSQSNTEQRKQLLGENFVSENSYTPVNEQNSLLSVQLNDMTNYLVGDILKKVDMASMMYSLEVRVPFLDFRLVPLVLSLPDNQKINGFITKFLLKNIAQKYIPKEIINRPKQGFSVPIAKWLKESSLMKEYLLGNYFEHGLLDKTYILKLYEEHQTGKADHSRILWLSFVFNYWKYKKN